MHTSLLIPSIFVAVCWSVTPVIYKYALGYVSQATIVFTNAIIFFLLGLVYFLFARSDVMKDMGKVLVKRDVWGWLLLGAIIMFFGHVVYMWAIKNGKSYAVTALAHTSPLFALLLAWLILKEAVTVKAVTGVIAIVIGVFLLVSDH